MTGAVKQNMYAVILAGFLSFVIYQFVLTNPLVLTADISGILSQVSKGDVRYHIHNNTLIVRAGKNFDNVTSLSFLISFDPQKVLIKRENLQGIGNISVSSDVGTMQVLLDMEKQSIKQDTLLFQAHVIGTDSSQIVVNDVVVGFADGRSDVVSVGVEN